MEIIEQLKTKKQYLGNYYYLFILQYQTGCRITEALNICPQDLSPNGMVLVKGLKKSQDRVCYIPELQPLINKSLSTGNKLFFSMNRFTAYRLLKSIGIQKLKKGRERESVTHIFRDQHAKNIRDLTSNEIVLSQQLGHKNQRNSEYYGKD